MTEQHFPAGAIIFKEGDDSHRVFRVIAGKLEVFKQADEREFIIGSIDAGEFVGEMGVIENKPRGATVRAANEVTLEPIDRADFLRRISENSDLALQLLVRLSERLNLTDQLLSRTLEAREPSPVSEVTDSSQPAPLAAPLSVRLFGGSDQMAANIPSEGISIDSVTYVVGRAPGKREGPPTIPVQLPVADTKPYRMSRTHFSIEHYKGGVIVRDLHSTLGTVVNDKPLGTNFSADAIRLERGENTIAAGGPDSPFAFRVQVG